MNSVKHICTLCDFVYEAPEVRESTQAAAIPSFQSLPNTWQCPGCAASKEYFEPCTCSTYPSFEPDAAQRESIREWIKDVELTEELFELASAAAKHYEHSKGFAVPVIHMGPGIHRLAKNVSGNEQLEEKDVLSVFFDGPAIKEVREKSINYYWFWRIIEQCALRAESLRIGLETTQAAISELREKLTKQFSPHKRIYDLNRAETALYVIYGIVVLKHQADHSYTLMFNPLFTDGVSSTNQAQSSLVDLVEHIESNHHAFAKQQLPHLSSFIERITALHQDCHPELKEVNATFGNLKAVLERHMQIEKETVFPLCREIGLSGSLTVRPAALGEVMKDLEKDCQIVVDALRRIRILLKNYAPPPDACDSYCTLLSQIADFEVNLNQHVSKENHVLFPGLRAIAAGLSQSVSA